MSFHPYLFFGGNCRQAFTRYKEIFGGELTMMTMAEAPSDQPIPPEQADMVIHAALTIGDSPLMGSDDPTGGFSKVQGMQVTYTTAGSSDAERVFNALADGGQVNQPLIETFFSPRFGMCVDRFGTPWMVVADMPGA
jgi:PhnB protein